MSIKQSERTTYAKSIPSCFWVFGILILSGIDGFSAPAKAVIEIWMWGGPCHLDTFDPKPDAGYDYCGPLNETVQTNVPGISINAALPLLAKQAEKYAIIRSLTHGINAHETASYMMQTGRYQGAGIVYPSVGAVVSKFLGYENGYTGELPPYVVLTETKGRFAEEGFLGPRFKPLATGGDPSKNPFVVDGIITAGISDERHVVRREFLRSLDTLGKQIPGNELFRLADECQDKAYGLILGDVREVFNLGNEADALRDRYGRNAFGQSCLAARRLVEAGVKYITINYKGWDTHKEHFVLMKQKLPELDAGLSALLQDLSDRGLLDSTIVWCVGDFGRTPKVQWEQPWNGGRSHFGSCFSALVAGGGFVGGKVVGASDARGERVVERPVYPQDLIASIYTLLGIDPYGPMPNPMGLNLEVVEKSKGEGMLKEIMKGPL